MEGDFLNIEDLDQESIDAILGLGTADQRSKSLEEQMLQAQSLRNARGPQGRGYGGIYTAANPLEHVVHAAQGIKAGKDMDRIQEEQQALMREQTEGRKKFLDALIRQRGMAQPMPQTGYGPQPFNPQEIY